MRTNFPPTGTAPSPRDSLRRALVLSILLVIVWTAIAYLPDPAPDPAADPIAHIVEPGESIETEGAAADPIATDQAPAAGLTARGEALIRDADRSLIGPGYIFVLLILGGASVWAIWLRKQRNAPESSTALQEIGRYRLGPNQQIQLVRCQNEVLVLGVTQGNVSLLKSYPADRFPEATTRPAAAPSWTSTLAKATRALTQPNLPPAVPDPTPETGPDPAEDHELPEWTVATASAISDGPDFMHVLTRTPGNKTYKANTLYPPTGATN